IGLGAFCGLLATAPPVRATPLPPGGTVVPDQLAAFAPMFVASQNVALTGPTTGQITVTVFREASGTLDFTYRVKIDRGAPGVITNVGMGSCAGFTTDVSFFNVPLELNHPPTTASRTAGTGATVTFGFGTVPLDAVQNPNSSLLIVKTNATAFDMLGTANT